MTYRLDSDIGLAYGSFDSKKDSQSLAAHDVPKDLEKSRLVAWMVAHCPTDGQQEKYVINLKKYIDVDVYGGCGALACNRTLDFSSPDFYEMLEANHKFYLAFENSLCQDYVTEKLYQTLNKWLVPAVNGRADYSLLAPPRSYIDARQFKPRDLANYLRYLDADDEKYSEYFNWKANYRVRAGLTQMSAHEFCHLCRLLHADQQSIRATMTWRHNGIPM